MFIIASARIFGWLLVRAGAPIGLADWLEGLNINATILLTLLVLILLFVGTFLEAVAAVIILAPFIQPLASSFGIQELHLALIVIVTLMVGTLTPPVALVLLVACSVGNVRMENTFKYLPSFLGALIGVIALLIAIPQLSTFLPTLLK